VDILAISGSLSAASSNTALVRALRHGAAPDDEITVFGGLDDIPHFSPERDRAPVPPAVEELRARVVAADALIIATPEYAGGMPGSLKNALDWLVGSGELHAKPVVVISAAPSVERGHNARSSLELTLQMQGAAVRDSFTVALHSGDDDGTTSVIEGVMTRARRALLTANDPPRP
jgi:chromate reductase